MAQLLPQALNGFGINRHFPLSLAHGPLHYQGMNIPHLFHEQGFAHLQKMLRYSYESQTPTGKQLHAVHDQLLVETGLNPPLLSTDFMP